jgi:hypothetical protein
VRQAYIALGGSAAMGLGVATVVRLFLARLVLGVPTLLMGGTLPAAGKAVETEADVLRRKVAVLYAANILGAVTGAFLRDPDLGVSGGRDVANRDGRSAPGGVAISWWRG